MILTIERLGHLGDGVAHDAAGQAIYVAQTLPGEVVEGEQQGDTLTGVRIITPSPQRVRPPCPHYRTCGGCSLQHAADPFVADWKSHVVRTALAAQGIEAPFRPILTSPPRSRRRAVLAGQRTKTGAVIGFHGRASGTLVQITDCHLLHPDLMAALPVLEQITLLGGSRKAEVSLDLTRSDAGYDLAVSGAKPADAPLQMELARIAAAHRIARLTWNGEGIALIASPYQTFGAARVAPPPGGFLQATAEGEAALVAAVIGAVTGAVGKARRIADLFAGSGTFALPLAADAEVLAVESDGAMMAALAAGWRQAKGLKRVTCEVRDLFRRPLLPHELNRFDAVVIDPPRAGAEAQVAEIAASRVPAIAAVSCNPVTFARDARVLVAGGYRLDWVQVVDQFRWSPHVELAASFTKQ